MYFRNVHRLAQTMFSITSELIQKIQRERLVAAKSRLAQFEFDGKTFNSSVFSAIFLDASFHQWKQLPVNFKKFTILLFFKKSSVRITPPDKAQKVP